MNKSYFNTECKDVISGQYDDFRNPLLDRINSKSSALRSIAYDDPFVMLSDEEQQALFAAYFREALIREDMAIADLCDAYGSVYHSIADVFFKPSEMSAKLLERAVSLEFKSDDGVLTPRGQEVSEAFNDYFNAHMQTIKEDEHFEGQVPHSMRKAAAANRYKKWLGEQAA